MARRSNEITADGDDDMAKSHIDNVEVVAGVANADKPNPKREAPPYVAGLTPEEREKAERALVRKIDWRLLPIVIIMYILNYLDRNNIASARLAGLEDDLNLVGNQYQTCVSILFVGYLLMQSKCCLLLYHSRILSRWTKLTVRQSPPTCCSTNSVNHPSTSPSP